MFSDILNISRQLVGLEFIQNDEFISIIGYSEDGELMCRYQDGEIYFEKPEIILEYLVKTYNNNDSFIQMIKIIKKEKERYYKEKCRERQKRYEQYELMQELRDEFMMEIDNEDYEDFYNDDDYK